ncbi:RNA polymerase sigma factor [Granulicoccus phenolivorans]|uniref:RNA polymerase sigma factor n=1 Tax=Granulicoccus phenolivorans TaxID=266854 RepID=UPI000405B42D|nr:sigma-70 family RNA polymerase sigma factor [Granulicoccus phenolivorans]
MFSLTDRAPDAALVAGLAVNDEAATVAFVRRFEGPVFGLALSLTRDRGLAEDISQDVFLRAWKAAGTYDQRRGSVLTWLLTITRNRTIDLLRTRRPTPIDTEILEQLVATTLRTAGREDPGVPAAAEEAASRLAQLPRDQARAVILAVIGGNTAQQVADHEGIPLGTAKTRIRTGLRRLRAAMEVNHD